MMKKAKFKLFKKQLLEAVKIAYKKDRLDFLLENDNRLQQNIVLDLLNYDGIPYIGYLLKRLELTDVWVYHSDHIVKHYDLCFGDIISEYNYNFKRIEVDFYSVHLYV